jgi:hypothetical protein
MSANIIFCSVDVWRQADRFEGRSRVSNWIRSIARFKTLSALHRRRDAQLDDIDMELIEDSADTPEEVVLNRDRSAQLRICLAQMSRDDREILDLVYYQEKSVEVFRGKLEHGFGAGRVVEEGQPIGDRVLLRGRCQLVHEAFHHENVVGRPDTAPERRWNARRFDAQILDVHVRQRVGQMDRALGGVGIETILQQRRGPSRDDRGACVAMVPSDRHSLRIETGGHPVEESWPVHVVLDVFLARPHDLDGTVDVLGDLDCANDACACSRR